ncbi:polysaccharide deacetylase family protein [Peribacillus kribbensis]|uniref:polysaccharide deacetylase family protein n=1 Tax=Peribacillus kribbensis TaxID=356658 RepID=UPI0004124913|nr:polysaccharide deacetylase family protein [Peribacillus kribbensis]
MLKKFLYILCMAAFIVSAGCSGTGTKEAADHIHKEGTQAKKAKPQTKEAQKEPEVKNQDTHGTENSPDAQKADPVVKPITPQYRINPNNWSIVPLEKSDKKEVLLTIDDAPDKHAVEMAKTLKGLGIKAIFFVNGHFIDSPEGQAKLKELHDLGFIIGNHTQTHANLTQIPESQQYKEIVPLNQKIKAVTGEAPKFFRAPYGANTAYSKKLAAQEKMAIMNWTFGYDWVKEYQNKDALTKIMISSPYLSNGANLLMHDRTWTMEALPGIIKGFQDKGYSFIDPALIEVPK